MKLSGIQILLLLLSFTNLVAQDYIYVSPSSDQKIMYSKPDGSGFYTVLPKNTLFSIAKLHGMSVEDLKSINGLPSNTIYIAQKLKVEMTSTIGKGLNVVGDADRVQANVSLKKEHLKVIDSGELTVTEDHPTMLRASVLRDEKGDLEALRGQHFEKGDLWWYVPLLEDNFHTISYKYDMGFDELRDLNAMNDYLYRKGMVLIVKPGPLFGYVSKPENMPIKPVELNKVEDAEIESARAEKSDVGKITEEPDEAKGTETQEELKVIKIGNISSEKISQDQEIKTEDSGAIEETSIQESTAPVTQETPIPAVEETSTPVTEETPAPKEELPESEKSNNTRREGSVEVEDIKY